MYLDVKFDRETNGNHCRYESMKRSLFQSRCFRAQSAKSYDKVRFGGSSAKKVTFGRFARILKENGGGAAGLGEQDSVHHAKTPVFFVVFLKDCYVALNMMLGSGEVRTRRQAFLCDASKAKRIKISTSFCLLVPRSQRCADEREQASE